MAGNESDGPLTKLTVLLIPQARIGLEAVAKRGSMSETDAVNIAIQAWAFIDAAVGMECELFMRYPNGDIYKFEPQVS